MKRFSAGFVFLIASMAMFVISGCSEEKHDPVKSFEVFINDKKAASENEVSIWQDPDTKKWNKYRNRTSNLKYDVQSNDSLVNPYKGVVTFTFLVEAIKDVETEEEAKAATAYPNNIQAFTVALNYVGSEEGWKMIDGAYFFNSEPTYTYPLNPTRIKTVDGTPFMQLVGWL